MTDKYPHKLQFPDAGRKTFERIAALLDLDDWKSAIVSSGDLALQCAEEYAKGKTEVICVIPRIAEFLQSNPEFLNALCKEGVVEWLTPLVLTKSATVSND